MGNFKENKNQGQEIEIPCPQCNVKTYHLIKLDLMHYGNEEIQWEADYQIVQCQGCKNISYRTAGWCSEDYDYYQDGSVHYNVAEELYPPRTEGKVGIVDTHLIPKDVRRIYKETLLALQSKQPVLSGIGLRALVEAVCKHQNAKSKGIYNKINELVPMGILTKNSADILHKIRTLGNDAAHEVKPHDSSQLWLAMEIIENMLEAVYIIPKKVKDEF